MSIKETMTERGMTQFDLSQAIGVPESYINRLVNNKVEPRVTLAIRIAAALSVRVEDLWQVESDNHQAVTPEASR